jgi:NAD(P)-dependent dehydrogenase (short-subunit alcohol dehydrogenase family)
MLLMKKMPFEEQTAPKNILAVVIGLMCALWLFLSFYQRRSRRNWLKGRVVWVTGASSGIGKALAFRLAVNYGARVIVSARRVELLESLATQVQEALQARAEKSGQAKEHTLPPVLIEPLDLLANAAALERTVRRVREQGASVVILNAGVNQDGRLFADTSVETLRQVLQINLWAPALIMRLLLGPSPGQERPSVDHAVMSNTADSIAEPPWGRHRGLNQCNESRPSQGVRLRILVALKHMFGTRLPATEIHPEQWSEQQNRSVSAEKEEVNTLSPLHLVLISSLAAYRALPGGALYGATKAALNYLAESLRIELQLLHNHAVHLTTVCPGFVDTPAIAGQRHWKPFCQSPEAAAEHIIQALLGEREHYGFPWIMEQVVMPIARILPTSMYRWLMKKSWHPPVSSLK